MKKLFLWLLFMSLASCIAKSSEQHTKEQTAIAFNREEAFNKHLFNILKNNRHIFLTEPSENEVLIVFIKQHLFQDDFSNFSDLHPQIYQQCEKKLPKNEPLNEYAVMKALFKTLKFSKKYAIVTFQIDDTLYFKKEDQWYYAKHNKEKIFLSYQREKSLSKATNIILQPITSIKPITYDRTIMTLFSWGTTCAVAAGCYICWPSKNESRPDVYHNMQGSFFYKLALTSTGGFQNLRSTCYANAANQALLMAWPKFFDERKQECNPEDDAKKIALCNDYIMLFNARLNKSVHTYDLLRVFKRLEDEGIWQHKGQSDAPEYLRRVIGYFVDSRQSVYNPHMQCPHLITYELLKSNFSIPFSLSSIRAMSKEPLTSRHILGIPIPKQKEGISMQELYNTNIPNYVERMEGMKYSLNDFLKGYNINLSTREQEHIKQWLFAKMLIDEHGFWKKLIARKNEFAKKNDFIAHYDNKQTRELLTLISESNIDDFKNIIRVNRRLPVENSDLESFKIACSYLKDYFDQPGNQDHFDTKLTELSQDQPIINIFNNKGIHTEVINKIIPSMCYDPGSNMLQVQYTYDKTIGSIKIHSDKLIIMLKRFNNKRNKIHTPVLEADRVTVNGRTFTLKSFVYHRGSFGGGHYMAFGIENGQYMCYNDSYVFPILPQRFLEDSKKGYLFFYKLDESA